MKFLIYAILTVAILPYAFADNITDAVEQFKDSESSWPLAQFLILDARNLAVVPIEDRILQLHGRHDEASVRAQLGLIAVLWELGAQQIDARAEMDHFAGTHNDMIAALCDLANEPLAKNDPDFGFVIRESIIHGRLDDFLALLERPEMTTDGILNLFAVFNNWFIRDNDTKSKIDGTLKRIVHRYKQDGYIWKWRWGSRTYSDTEENAVTEAAKKIRSKSLLK